MFSMCGTTKYPYLWSKGGYWKFSGEEIFKGQNFRRKYGAKLEFLEAWRRRGEGSIKKHPWEKYILIFCNKTIKAVTNVIKIEM